MSGERMTQIYVQVCLGKTPELKTDEERNFFEQLTKEMAEKEKRSGENIQWFIPSE